MVFQSKVDEKKYAAADFFKKPKTQPNEANADPNRVCVQKSSGSAGDFYLTGSAQVSRF
jgi:hypothetical protein